MHALPIFHVRVFAVVHQQSVTPPSSAPQAMRRKYFFVFVVCVLAERDFDFLSKTCLSFVVMSNSGQWNRTKSRRVPGYGICICIYSTFPGSSNDCQ